MKIFSGDKNYLAMLAIPVILFAIVASSNDLMNEKNVSEDQDDDSSVFTTTEAPEESTVEKKQSAYKKHLVRDAVEKNDYQAFLHGVEDTSFGEIMTEEAFAVLVERYKLHKSGYIVSTPSSFGFDSFTDTSGA